MGFDTGGIGKLVGIKTGTDGRPVLDDQGKEIIEVEVTTEQILDAIRVHNTPENETSKQLHERRS